MSFADNTSLAFNCGFCHTFTFTYECILKKLKVAKKTKEGFNGPKEGDPMQSKEGQGTYDGKKSASDKVCLSVGERFRT